MKWRFEKISLTETSSLEIMSPEQIFSHPPKVLSQEQREDYFDSGYVKVEELIPKNTLVELRRLIDKVLDASREETLSVTIFDLGPGHSPQKPVLRRLKKSDEYDQVFWDFASSLIADVASDIAGPNVVCFITPNSTSNGMTAMMR